MDTDYCPKCNAKAVVVGTLSWNKQIQETLGRDAELRN